MNHGSFDDLEEDPRSIEAAEEFDRLSRNEDFAKGRVLCQVRDEKLFGRWECMKYYAPGRLRITDRHASYLMDAAEILDLLKEHGCQCRNHEGIPTQEYACKGVHQLPINARQCRPLSSLKNDDLRVLAWTRACQQKQGSPPDSRDMAREVRRLLSGTPDEESDTAYRAYRKLLESAQSEHKKAHAMLEEGELDGFLAANDKKSIKQRVRLIAAVEKFVEALSDDVRTLRDGCESVSIPPIGGIEQKAEEDFSI